MSPFYEGCLLFHIFMQIAKTRTVPVARDNFLRSQVSKCLKMLLNKNQQMNRVLGIKRKKAKSFVVILAPIK